MSTENFQLFNDFTLRKYVFAFFAFIRGLRARGFLNANIENLLYTRTSKDTAVVFTGTFVNVLAGGLFFILAPRILGPSDFGLFSTVIATGMLAANIANFGIDTGILRFAKGEDFNNIPEILFVFGIFYRDTGCFNFAFDCKFFESK